MTIKELFDDYEAMCINRYAYSDLTNEERKQQIIQEVEALVRKEIFKELDAYGLEPRYVLVQCAQSKGIQL